ncbi:hypothetical protein Goshw_028980 [Gossypium schwendimanii]|uniref:Uncharacterized protein n=1 Tax=Gossypium schwendimanii TaxID=34291 RepID=A0A7J9NF30_GOSSC|nr:hypothetical protein [Gossypium schwendimanii]
MKKKLQQMRKKIFQNLWILNKQILMEKGK